jgi:hypothetical protein
VGKIARVRILFQSACLLVLAGCAAPPAKVPDVGERAPDMGQHRFGEAFSTNGMMEMIEGEVLVGFMGVVDDSRCPKKVTCIWQGSARVKIGVVFDHQAERTQQEILLTTFPEAARTSAIRGFRIELVDVAPYPETAGSINPDDYTVTLRVTRDR